MKVLSVYCRDKKLPLPEVEAPTPWRVIRLLINTLSVYKNFGVDDG